MNEAAPSTIQRWFLEMVLDFITDSKYMSAEFQEWTEIDGELPSHVAISDPNVGTFEMSFRIDLVQWKDLPGIYDAVVIWRLE